MSEIGQENGGVAVNESGHGEDQNHPHSRACLIEIGYNGQTKPFHVELSMHVQNLLQQAIREFHVTQNAHVLALYSQRSGELADSQSLKDQGVECGDHLVMRQSTVKGGVRASSLR